MVRYPPGSNMVVSVADNRGDSPSKLLRDPQSHWRRRVRSTSTC
jgi:hypothetical protein